MSIYKIIVRETARLFVSVKANSPEEAVEKAQERYCNGKYECLKDPDYDLDVQFEAEEVQL